MAAGFIIMLLMAQTALAAPLIPSVNVDVGTSGKPQDVAVTLQMMALMTILSLAPVILIMTNSFVLIVVVIGFLLNALSTQNVPPNQVVIALSLFLTFYIMSP
ncbi:MAG: flagellar biosynthetic protein FliP, partial [Selenomonas sp.]|nr:flagellar biosynthetic protein FliP [Selenomonas sp.]